KFDSTGNLMWQKAFELGSGSVQPTSDNGYIMAGFKLTGDGALCPGPCLRVAKLDPNGSVAWFKEYRVGSGPGAAYSIRQTSDSGYIVGGSYSTAAGYEDALVMKLDSTGNVTWARGFETGVCSSYGIRAEDVQEVRNNYYVILRTCGGGNLGIAQ